MYRAAPRGLPPTRLGDHVERLPAAERGRTHDTRRRSADAPVFARLGATHTEAAIKAATGRLIDWRFLMTASGEGLNAAGST
jgi:hypothetical protein